MKPFLLSFKVTGRRPIALAIFLLLTMVRPPVSLEASGIADVFSASKSMVEVLAEGGGMFKVPAGPKGPARVRAIQFSQVGGGVIVDPSGIVVTNAHILKNAARVTVTTSDRKKYAATLLYAPEGEDLAFLKIMDARDLPAIFFADSDKLKNKDIVYSIGNSPLLHGTLMEGKIVGFVRNKNLKDGAERRFLRINYQVYSGDSGTAVFDGAGRLVGLTTAGSTKGRRPVALAITSNQIKRFLPEALSKS